MGKNIYMDYASTTPQLKEVTEAMMPFFEENFGNPQNLHSFGESPKNAIDEARAKVAGMIGADPSEVYFTSSGTESNNTAIKGIAAASGKKGKHIITTEIEHHSVHHSLRTLEKQGYEATYIPVDRHGMVNPEDVKSALRPDTILVSVTHASNEIGTIEPISEIANLLKESKTPFHTDAVQTAGTIPVDVNKLGADLLSISAHQFYGPKGVGALYIRNGTRIIPFIDGGIQENGRRAGTENVPGIVGMGKACEIAAKDMDSRIKKITELRKKLIEDLTAAIPHSFLNGHPENRLPGNANISFEYIEGESMLLFLNMQGVATSSGSACTSRALKASHVLTAMGIPPEIAQGSMLFSLGIYNSEEDVKKVCEVLPPIVERLRQMSPLYEEAQKAGKI